MQAMSCGNKPLRKLWDKPKKFRTVRPSRYEQNEPYVKMHWKNVLNELEMSYHDDKFWETNYQTVRELVDPITFERIAQIFNLPLRDVYQPKDLDDEDVVPSEVFHTLLTPSQQVLRPAVSVGSYESTIEEESVEEEESVWSSLTSSSQAINASVKSHSKVISKATIAKSFSKALNKSLSKFMSRSITKSMSSKLSSKTKSAKSSLNESAKSDDDMLVHPPSARGTKRLKSRRINNPHFDMLYCNESETDMIKWKSKYKQKTFEISASDEFSKKAEITTKLIAHEFYDWWVGLGTVEFLSEIKRPKDIEDLFQVWFDEHASRGLVIDSKILPCVLKSIATAIGEPEASCPDALERQIKQDIHAETSPAKTMAFGTCLPHKMKHIPPKNNTEETWHVVKIPEDLRTMETVWGEISHLTSTKSFQQWLEHRSYLPMPECLRDLHEPKEELFAVPSDYVMRERSSIDSKLDLAFPVSQHSIEIKEVLSKLLRD